MNKTEIVELDGASLVPSVNIIRAAFGEVTEAFGITEANTPMFAAYTTIGNLEAMKARGVRFFGLLIQGSQAGVVALEKESDGEYYMKRLAVLPGQWHGGLGRKLVNHVVGVVRSLGVKKLRLGMVDENKVLKDWYLKMGFREIEVKKIARLPFTVGILEKDL